MYLFHYANLIDSAKQLGEQTYAYRLLRKEVDNKRNIGAISFCQWASERAALDTMMKEIDREYKYVHTHMNAIVFTTEHPEGEVNRPLIRIYLETAYPDEDPETFCIMQD